MRKKILFVVNVDWFFISHRLPIAIAASNNGYQVHIATTLTNKIDDLKKHGFTVHSIEIDRSQVGIKSTLKTLIEIWQVFKLVKPDLVHLVTIKPVILGGIIARLAGIPAVVAAVSGLGFVFVAQGKKAVLRRWLVGLLYRCALGHKNINVIFQNHNDKTTLTKATQLPEEKTKMIHGSGVDLSQYVVTCQPEGKFIVLMAARLLLDKGVREFVQAAKILKNELDNYDTRIKFVLVGEPDPGNPLSLPTHELQQWIEEGIIDHWGYRNDMPAVISSANIVVLPSYYGEGLPKVLIEAGACGRAVITTDHPGCRDAIDPKKSGILVPIRDAKALAAAILILLKNPKLCLTMGQEGRKLAEREFDVQQVVAAHLEIYNQLLSKFAK